MEVIEMKQTGTLLLTRRDVASILTIDDGTSAVERVPGPGLTM
jgi:ribosomal protein L29